MILLNETVVTHIEYLLFQGDLIINVPNVIEAVTKIISVSDNSEILKIAETDR